MALFVWAILSRRYAILVAVRPHFHGSQGNPNPLVAASWAFLGGLLVFGPQCFVTMGAFGFLGFVPCELSWLLCDAACSGQVSLGLAQSHFRIGVLDNSLSEFGKLGSCLSL